MTLPELLHKSMQASVASVVERSAAIENGTVHQRYISLRRGFACPHRMLYGGESCSDYLRRVLIEQNLTAAIGLAPSRFAVCKAAAVTLISQKAQGDSIILPCCLPF